MNDPQDNTAIVDRINYSVAEFAKAYGISRAKLYEYWAMGDGPEYFMVGARRLIPASQRAWRPGEHQEQAA